MGTSRKSVEDLIETSQGFMNTFVFSIFLLKLNLTPVFPTIVRLNISMILLLQLSLQCFGDLFSGRHIPGIPTLETSVIHSDLFVLTWPCYYLICCQMEYLTIPCTWHSLFISAFLFISLPMYMYMLFTDFISNVSNMALVILLSALVSMG